MSDNTMMVAQVRSLLQGLPQRLVADGLVSEGAMIDAISQAKERRSNLVAYLVEHNLADSREVAIAASQEFGTPLLDLDAVQLDYETVRIVSAKLLQKHNLLPLVKRGKRLFIASADPTNLQGIDEIKFATGLSVETIVVEQNKLAKALHQALEQVDTTMPAMSAPFQNGKRSALSRNQAAAEAPMNPP